MTRSGVRIVAGALSILGVVSAGCRERPRASPRRPLAVRGTAYTRSRLDVAAEFRPVGVRRKPAPLPAPSYPRPPAPDRARDSLGSFYSPRLLMPGEPYSEWAPGVTGQTWFGLFAGRTSSVLRAVTMTIEPLNTLGDSVAAGGRVKVPGKHQPLFLVPMMPGVLPDWRTGPISPALSQQYLRPGENRDFRLSGGTFRLRVTGTYVTGNVTDYELRIVDVGTGRSQVLKAYHPPPEYAHEPRPMPHVVWAGDLDRDGKLDVLVQDDMSELAGHWTLYLSSAARGREIVHRVAELEGGSC